MVAAPDGLAEPALGEAIDLSVFEAAHAGAVAIGVAEGLTIRDMGFAYPDDFDPRWNPRLPEFASSLTRFRC